MKKILMAEDEENISDFVRRGLAGFGYEVTVAEDGTQAWQLLDGKSSDFDLVLLDIRMPGLSGLEVCHRLREQQGYSIPCTHAHRPRHDRRHCGGTARRR